jgi:hypothetical protein
LHEAAESRLGEFTIGRNVDYVLQLKVVQQESSINIVDKGLPMNWTISAVSECVTETVDEKSLGAFFPLEDSPVENHRAVLME